MKRLSISELKAQKGALVKAELYMGGENNCCHNGECKPIPMPRDKTRVQH